MNPPHSPQAIRLLCVVLMAGVFISSRAVAEDSGPDWPVVAEQSERTLEKNPGDDRAWAQLAEARLATDDLDRTEKALADWRKNVAHPSPQIESLAARLAFAREDYKGAIKSWRNYLELEPRDTGAWHDLASLYADAKDWPDAIDAVSRRIELAQAAADFAERARYRIRLHDWANAGADVLAGNKSDATNVDIQGLMPAFERKSEWLSTVTKFDAELAKDAGNAPLHLDRAEWLAGEGFVDAAGDDVDAAFKLDPKSLRARVWRGIIAWESNDAKHEGDVMNLKIADLTPAFEADLKKMDTSTDPEARARFLLKYNQPLLALDEVKDIDGSVAKAQALLALKRLPEAGIAARKAVVVHPQDSAAWLALGRIDFENGNHKAALDEADHSLKLGKTPEAQELRAEVQKVFAKK